MLSSIESKTISSKDLELKKIGVKTLLSAFFSWTINCKGVVTLFLNGPILDNRFSHLPDTIEESEETVAMHPKGIK